MMDRKDQIINEFFSLPPEIEERVDIIIDVFKEIEFYKLIIDEVKKILYGFIRETYGEEIAYELKKRKVHEKYFRYWLGIFIDSEFARQEIGYTFEERTLMEELGISLDEAKYIIENPCLIDFQDKCEHYKNHGKCDGCIYLNGFLFFSPGPNEKININYEFLKKLDSGLSEKNILIIDKEDIKTGKLDEKLDEFLE